MLASCSQSVRDLTLASFFMGFACQAPGRMLQFPGMKKALAAFVRYLSAFAVADICATLLFTAGAALDNPEAPVLLLALASATAAIPAAAVAACFVLFFRLNASVSSRALGYLALLALTAPLVAASALPYRFLYHDSAIAIIQSLPSGYRPVGSWMLEVAKAPLLEAALAASAFSALAASLWGSTRLSRTRPLIGAFVAPSAALGVLALVAVYRSNPAKAVFEYLGLSLSPALSVAALAALSAALLCALDALVARKPSAGGRDGR